MYEKFIVNRSNWALDDWLNWQENLNPNQIDLSLDRIKEVKEKIRFNQPEIDIYLVAGTNGKGTTVHLLNSILCLKGLNVGTYTSPHLKKYNERVTYNNKPLEDTDFIDSFIEIENVRGDVPLTYFEYGTLAAFLSLNRFSCDAWIIEVGLGGRLDATNILNPNVSIITNIALDHQEWLGNTVNEIASEKAGIISSNAPCVCGALNTGEIIGEIANRENTDFYLIGDDFSLSNGVNGSVWSSKSKTIEKIRIPNHWAQGEKNNLAIALMSIEACNSDLLPNTEALNQLLGSFSIPGRFQIFDYRIPWILDVAHNPNAAINLRERLGTIELTDKNIMIVSLMKDKDLEEFVSLFEDIVAKWVVCTMNTPRSLSGDEISKRLSEKGLFDVTVLNDPDEAFEYIETINHNYNAVIVTGSFEIVGPCIHWHENKK
ncbi:uncharacterized protein METZ01_LOCUS139302 [marine metagenome]|uniref:Uncharacterized protein n=1 Tax=marine metagenome TaxID=408172 RepID=A0A381ZAZ3_9ZZZZ